MNSESAYKKLYRIRKAENAICELYPDDEMKTPMHMSRGSEAITVSVVEALGSRGRYCGTYRTHALYLSITSDLDGFFLELYGREGGCSGGRGGSMHLFSAVSGLICTTAIVATNIPVAIGAAFANKTKASNEWVAVFFGDGAVDEGSFWESLNIASLMQLPILFIYEDNGFAVHSRSKDRHGYDSIIDIVSQFKCNTYNEESNDVEVMYGIVQDAIANKGPSFIRFPYYRVLEHVGICEDYGIYREREEMDQWIAKDPILLQRRRLTDSAATSIEKEIDDEVSQAVAKAKSAPFPEFTSRGVFCESNI